VLQSRALVDSRWEADVGLRWGRRRPIHAAATRQIKRVRLRPRCQGRLSVGGGNRVVQMWALGVSRGTVAVSGVVVLTTIGPDGQPVPYC
jgi:hypothetical protein